MAARELDVREAGELIGRSYARARPLYRIHMAVEPIKKALIGGELDARGAIEVDRVFNALEKAVGNEDALKRVDKLLARIVREKWPIRRIEQHAKKVAGGDDEESAVATSSGLSGEAVTAAPATVNRSTETTPDEAAPVVGSRRHRGGARHAASAVHA
jgi:hypothetical protein